MSEAINTILVIAPNDASRKTLEEALTSQGYNVLLCGFGSAGLDRWDKSSEIIDLIILDNEITDCSADEVINVLTGARPIPRLILASTLGKAEYRKHLRSMIIKPYHDLDAIADLIQRVLAQ